MLLLRLSGHSCAGKTRLVESLPKYGLAFPKVLRYTSRPARPGEKHGVNYYFMSRSFIRRLPEEDFLVGPVRNMLHAFDINQIELDLKRHEMVLIEIYPALWPRLLDRLSARLDERLVTASVFMTAVDPGKILEIKGDMERSGYISGEVRKMLVARGKDEEKDIEIRAQHAAHEILEAVSPKGKERYDLIIHSAPEGPDGDDDWTRPDGPAGQAKAALEQFISFIKDLR